jgi:hypothetical protein
MTASQGYDLGHIPVLCLPEHADRG